MKSGHQFNGLLADNRWNANSGIGRYSRELIPRVSSLIDGYLDVGNPTSIFAMSTSFFKSRNFAKFYSPGFIPLLGIKSQAITIHDLILANPKMSGVVKPRYFHHYILPRVRDGLIKVITVSNSSQNEIAEWAEIDKEQVPVVPNGISESILVLGEKVSTFRDPKSLIFVGNLRKHKNFLLFQKSVNLLPGSWSINLVGPDLNRSLIDSRHRVETFWNISDKELGHVYLKSSIMVNTSSFEGFGMPFLEGGYLGCKIVHLGVLPSAKEAEMVAELKRSIVA